LRVVVEGGNTDDELSHRVESLGWNSIREENQYRK
jgi:hypothetical protein